MPRFEVYVPAAPPLLPVDVTLRVESEHWLAALKAGLQKAAVGDVAANILCDIQADGSIHVSDPESGRVFRIKELPEGAAPPAPPPAAQPIPLRRAAEARPAPVPAPASVQAPARPRPSSVPDKVEQVARPSEPPPKQIGRTTREIRIEETLGELFERVGSLSARRGRDDGLAFLLDLAMEKTGCESGSVLLAPAQDLLFAVARGPKAEEILRLGMKVPMGVGIVGFCALENVCLAVSDAEKDPRFYRAVSEVVGYATRSLLCAPIAAGGRVRGAMELVNKSGGRPFDQGDLSVLSYLAHQAAEYLDRIEG